MAGLAARHRRRGEWGAFQGAATALRMAFLSVRVQELAASKAY